MLGESIELYVLIEQKEHCATQKNQGLEALDSSLGLIFPSQGLTLARQCIILSENRLLSKTSLRPPSSPLPPEPQPPKKGEK